MEMMISALEERIKKAVKPYKGLPIALSGGVDSSLLAALIEPKFVISVELPGDEKYNEIEYSSKVAKHLGIKHHIVKLEVQHFDIAMKEAVKAIGRPIPHFNIFPLFEMYKTLKGMGEDKLILGDGPDETMSGYARDLIVDYLYNVYSFEAFENYKPLIDKILPPMSETVFRLTGKESHDMMHADMALMRPDMDDMSNRLGARFGVTNIRPYQDDTELDNFMAELPSEMKIKDVEYGKYALRKIAAKYLPPEIAWRKKKVGGPVFPVNLFKGWHEEDGEFGKKQYLEYQKEILNEGN